jgi:hypothetical protein
MARTNDVDLEVIDEFVVKAIPDRTVKTPASQALVRHGRHGVARRLYLID